MRTIHLTQRGPQDDPQDRPPRVGRSRRSQVPPHSPRFLEVYQHATELYGLIHARYITTPEGLAIMRERYLAGRFGNCPRVMCEKQNVLPIAISEDLKIARVKVYCPRCKDVYSPKKKSADADGAYFGTSFPHLLLMVCHSPHRHILTLSPISSAKSLSPRSSASN